MSITADIDTAKLTICLDLRHPSAYLALQPAIDLERSLGIAINWLPISVPTLKEPSLPADGDDRSILHRRNRAEAIAREIDVYAAAQGLVIREPYRSGDAAAADRAWLYMRDRAPDRLEDFLVLLFRSYWAVEVDACDDSEIAALVSETGGDGDAFRVWSADAGLTATAALAEELRTRGLFGVPTYVVEDEVFYGRQHLPMIRWILEGRSGRVPI